MRKGISALLCTSVLACAPDGGRNSTDAAGPPAAVRAAPAAIPADTSALAAGHRVLPLRPMTSDMEVLFGDPERVGEPFVMRIRELPGTRIPLHSHPVDEHITVVQGTWYFAVGERWDSTALRELPTGTYAFAPAGATMYGYSPEGAVVQVHGVGPFHIHWRDGSATLDDPDGASRFRFRKGEGVRTSRGRGVIRQGYRSGAIIQYEIESANGARFMADEQDLRGG